MFRPALCLAIMAFGLTALGCRSRTSTPPKGSSSGQAPVGRQQFGDFSFELPEGWLNVPPDCAKTKVTLLLGGSRWDNAKGMILVDVGSPSLPNAQAMADTFVKSLNGKVAKNAVDVDGEKGVKVTTSSKTLNDPRIIVIVYRRGKAYLIMAATIEGTDATEAFEQVRKSWKWSS